MVVAAHSDVGTGIGFGVECAGAHVSIPAKSFGRELTKSSPSTPQNLAMKARPVVFFYAFVRFGVVVVLMMMMAKSVVASFLAIGSAALFFSFRLHARQGLLWVDSMWVLGGSSTWRLAPPSSAWLLPLSGRNNIWWSLLAAILSPSYWVVRPVSGLMRWDL